MRIVLVGPAYPLRGGIAHYIALLYRSLRKRGHRTRVLSFRKLYPPLLFPGKTQEDGGAELLPVESVPVLNSMNPLSWLRAVLWLKEEKPDLLVFKYWMPFFAPCYAALAGLSRMLFDVPSLYICDNVVPHERHAGDVFLTRLGLHFIDFFIVQSASVQLDLLRFRPEADHVLVPHPVYDLFPPPVPKAEARRRLNFSDRRIILYFGYIRDYKGLRFLIEAMPGVLEKMEVRLLVCGEFYEGREETLRLIDRLGLKSHITVMDRFIPNEDVGLYFCASDVVVLPYVSATQSGIVQIAFHYNRPVIVTDVGGLPEVVADGRCGFVVPGKNPGALAGAIVEYYREKKEDAFARAIRLEKKKYSWDRMAGAIEQFLSERESPNRSTGVGHRTIRAE